MPAKRRKFKYIVIPLIYLLIWQIAALAVGQGLLLPSPWETLGRFFALMGMTESWKYAGFTLARIMAGYVLGVAIGAVLGIVCARFTFADQLLSPLRSVVKATPVTSFILLALLWLSSDLVPLFIALLMVVPIVWANVMEALLGTDALLLEMARAYGFSRVKKWRYVYMPSIGPSFYAACTTSLGFAWKSGVAAEIIALPKASIGYQLYQSKLQIETVDLFAWTLLIILLSMGLEWCLKRIMGRIGHD